MAKKKPTTADVAANAAREAVRAAEELEVLEADDLDSSEADALADLAQLGEGEEYTYVLECLSPIDKRGQIDTFSREDLPELAEYIRDKCGPGKYRVFARGPRGFVKGSHRKIVISALARAGGGVDVQGAKAAPAASGGFDFDRWRAEEERRAELRRQEEREDRKFMLQLAATVLPALLGNRESLSSVLQGLASLKAMTGEGAKGPDPQAMLDLFLRGLEQGKGLGGGQETVWGAIRETIKDLTNSPAVGGVLERIASRGAPPRPPALAPPGAPPMLPPIAPAVARPAPAALAPAAPGASPAPSGSPGDEMLQLALPTLNKLADELLEYAANGADPGLAAEALVAKVPRSIRAFVTPEKLNEWLTHPEWWRVLQEFRPALAPYQGYCDDVRQTLIRLANEPESEPEQP
jgi:hypothetical protein